MSASLQPYGLTACQVPLSMGFSRQEYWSGLLFPPPGNLPNAGIEPATPALQADAFTTEPLVEKSTIEDGQPIDLSINGSYFY